VIVASQHHHAVRGQALFSNLSVKFGGGSRHGLIGANGCGRSTIVKILSGEPSAWSVAIESN
jgi:ATPase subunit of ABC transporter with duplicated ATPase domains